MKLYRDCPDIERLFTKNRRAVKLARKVAQLRARRASKGVR